jgi:Uncharacterised nucleotidyltransferase
VIVSAGPSGADLAGPTVLDRGRRLADALAGAWRETPAPWSPSSIDMSAVVPLLLAGGCGALGWRRLRGPSGTGRVADGASEPLQHAYRLHALESAVREQQIRQALSLLRGAGIEPLLAKGWAAARLYPEPGLRPYGDIDLYVRPEQHGAAQGALRGEKGPPLPVDLHRGFADLDEGELDGVFERSRLAPLADVAVRVPSAEDHLRLLCLHALRHGVARAIWLCDIATALEARPRELDWEVLLGGEKRTGEAIGAAVGLARTVLGADFPTSRAAELAIRGPSWLVPAVLRQWGSGSGWREPMGSFLHRPRGAFAELLRHWPNPIEGTMGVRGPWNAWPRLPFQLAHVVVRGVQFARSLAGRGRQSTVHSRQSRVGS